MAKKNDLILAEALVEKGLIAQKDIDPVLKEAETTGFSLQQLLNKRGLFTDKEILNLLGEKLKLGFVDLKSLAIERAALEKVPVKVASYYKFILSPGSHLFNISFGGKQ